jgi:GT2 family glycosyltransferase
MSAADLALLIPTKGRHASLDRSLPSVARAAAGAPILLCDQSPTPYAAPGPWRVLHAPQLPGLPAARNALLRATTADWVVFLDDDTDLGADFVHELQRCRRADLSVSAWGPVVETRGPAERRLQRLAHLGCFHDDRRHHAHRRDAAVTALYGCCFAVRRDAALAIGGFDARLPGYGLGEDLDFFRRLTAAGHRCRTAACLRAIHRNDGANRYDPARRGRAKARFFRWLAARHGRGNPATPLHLALALAAAAAGSGREPAGLGGLLSGLWASGRG